MLTDRPVGYVDLRSPAGIGLGALVYNYDGRVFASDEGRMLAEMGDTTFELGNVATDTYRLLILSDKLVGLVASSLAQCAPGMRDCVFEPHCGADPVYHHATQRDPVGIKPLSEFCARQKGVMRILLDRLDTRRKTPRFCAGGEACNAAALRHRGSGKRVRSASPAPCRPVARPGPEDLTMRRTRRSSGRPTNQIRANQRVSTPLS